MIFGVGRCQNSSHSKSFGVIRCHFLYVGNCQVSKVLDVKACLKAIFRIVHAYGKSPWFLALAFLRVLGVDWRILILRGVDGGVRLV